MSVQRNWIAVWACALLIWNSGNANAQTTELFSAYTAREIGPTAFGGRIIDIETAPGNPFHIFAASASGGLWVSENHGTTWRCIFDKESTVSIGDIAIDPRDANVIWVGTGEANNQRSSLWGDGVYKSSDGGETWQHTGLSDTHHIGRIVIDPNDSNVVYVAALGHLYSSNEERGLFKTIDGGATWEKVLYINPEVGVVDVVLDPTQSQTLYAAAYQRLRRAWNLIESGPESAIYRSTDGGANWTRLSGGLPSGELGRIGLAVSNQTAGLLYASVANFNPATGDAGTAADAEGELASQLESVEYGQDVNDAAAANQDQAAETSDAQDEAAASAGQTESVVTPFGFHLAVEEGTLVVRELNRREAPTGLRNGARVKSWAGIAGTDVKAILESVARARETDQVVMVVETRDGEQSFSLEKRDEQQSPAGRRVIGGEIYRSEDGGETWTKMNRNAVGGEPPYYYGQIRVDPSDDQQLYVLGVPLFVSSDGGTTWRTDGARSVHVDHHAFWINPENSNHLYLGNDGGFHVSFDRGATWDHVANLPLAQFYAITVDMQQPYHVYGGTQDNGSWGGPSRGTRGGVGSNEWYRIGGGDGFYVQVDPNDSDYLFGESQFGAIFRLHRATGRSQSIRPPQSDPDGPRDRYNWSSPILMSTHDSRTIYFGGNKLFKSTDRGDNWEVISPDLTTADPVRIAGNVPHCTITTIAESALDRNLLMVGTDDGRLQRTTDGGLHWSDLTDRLPMKPADWWCSRVVLSRHDAQVAYVSFTGYREDDFRPFIFKSTDGGESWTWIADQLPTGSVNVIAEDPINKNLLFIGTEFSVFASLNGGDDWIEMNSGLTRASVHDLIVHPRDRDLVIGTHGRGVFIFDDISPLQQWDATVWETPVRLFEPRPAMIYQSGLREIADGSGNRRFTAENPPSSAKIWYHVSGDLAKDLALKLVITDLRGNEIETAELENKPGLHFHAVDIGSGAAGRGRRGGGQARQLSLRPGTYLVELTTSDGTQRVPLVVATAGTP